MGCFRMLTYERDYLQGGALGIYTEILKHPWISLMVSSHYHIAHILGLNISRNLDNETA